MPRDLMWCGPRPSGPRAAVEFDEVALCELLDAEDKAAEEDDEDPKAKPESYEGAELPPFEVP